MPTDEELLRDWIPDIYYVDDGLQPEQESNSSWFEESHYSLVDGKVHELYINNHPEIYSLPSFFKQFTSIYILIINDCSLSTLDNFPSSCARLAHLSLNRNQLTTLKGLPHSLPDLQILNFYGNQIRTLSDLPSDISNLIQFSASENLLNDLIGFPVQCSELLYLSLENNHLTSLTGLPESLPKLKYLGLEGNPLRSLPINYSRCPKLYDFLAPQDHLTTLHGTELEMIHYHRLNLNNFPPSVRRAANSLPIAAIHEEYRLSTKELVSLYCRHLSLSDIQKERIIYEGDFDDWDTIHCHLPQDRIILPRLEAHLKNRKPLF